MEKSELKKFWLDFKDKGEEVAYIKERSAHGMKWLNVQNNVFCFVGLIALILGIFGQLLNEEYKSQLSFLFAQLVWVVIVIFCKILQKYLDRFPERKRHKYNYYLCIFMVLKMNFLFCCLNEYFMKGNPLLLFRLVSIVQGNIGLSAILRQWKLQITITLPFFIFQLYQIIQHISTNPEDYLILVIFFASCLWCILFIYWEELNFRELFSIKRQLLREKEELFTFLQLIPFVTIQFNVDTKVAIQNKKGDEFIKALQLNNFDELASRVYIKGDRGINLHKFMAKKVSHFKRLSTLKKMNGGLRSISNDFIFSLSERKYSTDQRKRLERIELELIFIGSKQKRIE